MNFPKLNFMKQNDSAIKQDLNNLDKKITKRLDDSFEAFRREINHQFEVQNELWERNFISFESRIITIIDPLLQEMKTRQQEREIAASQIKHVTDDVTDLQKRVTKLEAA
jgi:hypothetical protein